MSWRVFGHLATILVVACLVASPLPAQEPAELELNPSTAVRVPVLVELSGEPAAKVFGEALEAAPGPRAAGLAHARRVAQDQFRTLEPEQDDAATALWFRFDAREIYRVRRALNALAVTVDSNRLDEIRRLPGVKRVRILETEYPTSSTSVPFLGVPQMWGDGLGLGRSLTGAGIRIGIIDTGIDYLHPNFAGSGVLADYQANDRTSAPDAYFPTAKVVGGVDFAGDAYTGSNTPAPDPDPMDCNGHGTHVAGTAAGRGVTAAGATYGGPYDAAAPFASLRIGPGAAPEALLYGLRVFGCTGGTNLTVQAIDWAIDPDGDGDFSDHLDVVNLSLGSSYGGATSATALAADNAALAGVIVVASAGNAGDTYFISGSPGSAGRAIATAAAADSGVAGAVLQANSPPAFIQSFLAAAADFTPTPPAPSGQTADVVLANDGSTAGSGTVNDGCQPLINAAAVAGKIALIERGGSCGFINKVQNAQTAGAIGVIVANNVMGDVSLVVMQGSGVTITIPSIFISKADSDAIRAQLAAGVNVTLAGANAADTLAYFSARGPRRSTSPFRLKPDITAPGLSITSSQSGVTCTSGACQTPNASGYLPDGQALNLSGTSMAAPHMAGVMALLRQQHPDWTVEELKALAMNTAVTSPTLGANGAGLRFGPGRVGAGRTRPTDAATSEVVAFNADEAGLVSVSFDGQVLGTAAPAIQTRTIRVVNKGGTAETYTLGIDTVVNAPGIAFSLPGGTSLTVPAGETLDFDVQMDAFGAQMDHAREASVPNLQAAPTPLTSALGNVARHWMTEEAGYVTFSQGGVLKKRVPLYAAARPASNMRGASTIVTGGAMSGATSIPLSGSPVCTGTLSGPVCSGSFPTDEVSLVTPFELQVVSPLNPTVPAYADLQYAGVAWSSMTNVIMFGVSTWGNWSTPTDVSFNVYVDFNEDGTWDRILFNSNPGTLASALFGNSAATGLDAFTSSVLNTMTSSVSVGGAGNFVNRVGPAMIDSALFNNHVMFLAATPAQLGLVSGDTKFKYRIVTCPGGQPLCEFVNGFSLDSAPGPYTWNSAAQGLNFGGANLVQDLPGATLPTTWNVANLTANGSPGALLLHHHNLEGTAAQAVLLDTAPTADLAISASSLPATPALGQDVTLTVTVTNGGPGVATGVVVSGPLPVGLTWVSDDSGGAYDPSTGLWSVGALGNAASASLQIVATVEQTDQLCVPFQITAATPLDTNPANNRVNLCLAAPRSADVALTMSVSSPTVLAGSSVTFTLRVANQGADPAYDVTVNEAFPAWPLLDPSSATPSQGIYNSATGAWKLASLGPGASATLDLLVVVPSTPGPLTNDGSSASSTADASSANNAASATTTVVTPPPLARQTVAGSFTPGGVVVYTVTVSNTTTFPLGDNPGNEFVEVLPSSLALLTASGSSGSTTSNLGTNTVTWDGPLAASGSVAITITARIGFGVPWGQLVSSQGSVAYDADRNGTNESTVPTDDPGLPGAADPTVFMVSSPANVFAAKTVAGTFRPGATVTYSIVLSNTSASSQFDNPGDEFTDVLPSALTLVGASATSGTATATVATNTVAWNGAIPGGASVTLTVTAAISVAATPGQVIANQGTVAYDADGNGTSEASRLTDDPGLPGAADPTRLTVLSPASLSASKSVAGTFQPGGTVLYTIVLTNGSSAAQFDNLGDEFTDVLPSSLTLAGATATSGTAALGANTVTWNGAVPGNGSVTLTVTATISTAATAGQRILNQGTVHYDADGDGTNESSAPTDDPSRPGQPKPTRFFVASPALITATKTVSGSFAPGSTVTYTVTLSNTSPFAQSDNPTSEFTDVLPGSLMLASASASSGTAVATPATRTVTWNGSIPGGGSVTITVAACIPLTATPGQVIANQGVASYDADGNGSNEASRLTDDPGLPGGSDPTTLVVAGMPRLAQHRRPDLARRKPGTTAATLTVTLQPTSTGTVTVSYATQDGYALSGSDYLAASGTLVFAPGAASRTITVPLVGDTVSEDNEGFAVNLGSPSGATLADAQGYVTILDDDTPGRPTPRQQALWQDFFAVDLREEPMVGDFDGDGLADVITFTRDNPLAVGDVYVALSEATRFGPGLLWHNHFAANSTDAVLVGDFDGDGRTDIATWLRTSTRQVKVGLSTGTAFTPKSVWVNGLGTDPTDVLRAGDVNGDGRADLVLFARTQGRVYVALSTGASFQPPAQWHAFFAVSTYERPAVGDFNGDGLADIVTFATDSPTAFGDVYVALSDGTRFGDGQNAEKWHDYFAIRPTEKVRVGDLDGDGRTDVFTFLPPPWGQCYTARSLGSGLGPGELWREVVTPLATDEPWVADVNGDGKADIVIFAQGDQRVYVSLAR